MNRLLNYISDLFVFWNLKKISNGYLNLTDSKGKNHFFGDNKRSRSGGKKYNNLKGGNPWGGISLDNKRGVLFITTGNPENYFIGVDRPGENEYTNSEITQIILY